MPSPQSALGASRRTGDDVMVAALDGSLDTVRQVLRKDPACVTQKDKDGWEAWLRGCGGRLATAAMLAASL